MIAPTSILGIQTLCSIGGFFVYYGVNGNGKYIYKPTQQHHEGQNISFMRNHNTIMSVSVPYSFLDLFLFEHIERGFVITGDIDISIKIAYGKLYFSSPAAKTSWIQNNSHAS